MLLLCSQVVLLTTTRRSLWIIFSAEVYSDGRGQELCCTELQRKIHESFLV